MYSKIDIPQPILPGNEDFVELYYFAWKMAHKHIGYNENLASPYYMDEACVPEYLWLWDTCLMTEYCRYAADSFPGIESLNNFYAVQKDDGYISMTHVIATGKDAYPIHGGRINPPLAAWVEWEYYQITGNANRFEQVLPHLLKLDEWIEKNRRREDGSYWFADCGSTGMDNSPRTCGKNKQGNNTNFIDLVSQQILAANHISKIAAVIGDNILSEKYAKMTSLRKDYLNNHLWSERDSFYYDVFLDGSFTGIKTVASFWPLLADAVPANRVDGLIKHLTLTNEFNRPHPVPTLSYDNPNYDESGGYWRGGVWAPTNYMIVRGLANYGYDSLAKQIAEKHISYIYKIWKNFEPNTIWECYSPEQTLPATKTDGKNFVRKDFVGWSGLGPISMLIENVIGIKVDYPNRKIIWKSDNLEKHGINNLPFGTHKISLLAKARKSKDEIPEIEIQSDCEFDLEFIPLKSRLNKINAGSGP